ncbi:hypothetical protein ACTHGU_07785 [Chitinophagaceae bacterium MMS25-I14]
MTRLAATIICILLSFGSFAQPIQGKRFERIHAAKIGYITDRLHLSSDQATKFWPMYNQYEEEQKSLRKNFFEKYKRDKNAAPRSEAVSRQYIDDNLDYQEALLKLKRRYKDDFLRIISPQQLAELYQAEREFKEMLLDKLQDGPHGGDRR